MLKIADIRQWATECGIDAIGAAKADYLAEDDAYLTQWLSAGNHGSMAYMERNQDLRTDPRKLVPNAKTVLVALQNYYTGAFQQTDAPFIAQSGLSREDYHLVMKDALKELGVRIFELGVNSKVLTQNSKLFCDSAPILERRWAVRAGLGWIGKNHQLIHPEMGSFVHIGILILPDEIDEYGVPMPSLCGDCDKCLKACPTGAFRGEGFDAKRCLSYLTIERKETLEQKYAALVKKHLYGCDSCQLACPYNQHLQPTAHPQLQANKQLLTMTANDWENISRRQKVKLLHRLAKEE